MKLSFQTLLIYFSLILTASTAAISHLTDFWAGWFLLMAAIIPTLITAYFENKNTRSERLIADLVQRIELVWDESQGYIDELESELEDSESDIFELTEAAIHDGCNYCGSKHSLLGRYPFDPAFHMKECPVPSMRSRIARVEICDPGLIEEYSKRG